MSENKKLVPKRRFKEFENADAWKQRELGDWGYFYYGKSAPKWSLSSDAPTPCVRYGELYTKHSTKIEQIYSYTNIPKKNLRFSKGKEVLIPRVGEDPMDFANCAWLSLPDVAIGEMISVFNTEQNPLFTAYMFNAKLQKEFAKRVEGGNVSNLYYKTLENIPVLYPNIDEQIKIVDFFDNLDQTIAFQQRKLEKMKSMKSAYLSEMFPAEGERKPKRRFPGFTDDWEQREFIDIVQSLHGGASITPGDYINKGVGTIPKGAVNDSGIADLSGTKYISEEYFQKNRSSEVFSNDLVTSLRDLVPTAPNLGRIVKVPAGNKKYLMPQGVYKITLEEGIDENFVIAYSNSDRYRKLITAEKNGSTQVHIRNNEFLNIEFPYPKSEEQRAIGSFFKSIDQNIAFQQHKLEKLQNIKKAYLNEMFI